MTDNFDVRINLEGEDNFSAPTEQATKAARLLAEQLKAIEAGLKAAGPLFQSAGIDVDQLRQRLTQSAQDGGRAAQALEQLISRFNELSRTGNLTQESMRQAAEAIGLLDKAAQQGGGGGGFANIGKSAEDAASKVEHAASRVAEAESQSASRRAQAEAVLEAQRDVARQRAEQANAQAEQATERSRVAQGRGLGELAAAEAAHAAAFRDQAGQFTAFAEAQEQYQRRVAQIHGQQEARDVSTAARESKATEASLIGAARREAAEQQRQQALERASQAEQRAVEFSEQGQKKAADAARATSEAYKNLGAQYEAYANAATSAEERVASARTAPARQQVTAAQGAERIEVAAVREAAQHMTQFERATGGASRALIGLGQAVGVMSPQVYQLQWSTYGLTSAMPPLASAALLVGLAVAGIGVNFAESAIKAEQAQAVFRSVLQSQGQAAALPAAEATLDARRGAGRAVGADFADQEQAVARFTERLKDVNLALQAEADAIRLAELRGTTFKEGVTQIDTVLRGEPEALRNIGIELSKADEEWLAHLDRVDRARIVYELLHDKLQNVVPVGMHTTKNALGELAADFDRFREGSGAKIIEWAEAFAGAINQTKTRRGGDPAADLVRAVQQRIAEANAEQERLYRESGIGPTGPATFDEVRTGRAPELRDDRAGAGRGAGSPPPYDPREELGFPAAGAGPTGPQPIGGDRPGEAFRQAQIAHQQQVKATERAYTDLERQIRQTWEHANRDAEDSARTQRVALDGLIRAHAEDVAQQRVQEEQRHTAEDHRIRDGEAAEIAALEHRKQAWNDWAQNAQRAAEATHLRDMRGIEDAEAAERERFRQRTDQENARYGGLGGVQQGFQDERRGRQIEDEGAKRGIDRDLEARSAQRESDKALELAGIRELTQAREAQYRQDEFGLQRVHDLRTRALEDERTQLAAALQEERTQRERSLQDERTSRQRALEDARTAQQRAHQDRLHEIEEDQRAVTESVRQQERAIEEGAARRRYAEQAGESQYDVQRARFEVLQAQAKGEDHNRIVELQHALQRAQQRQGDQIYGEAARQLRGVATDEGEQARVAAEGGKAAEDARYRAQQDALEQRKRTDDDYLENRKRANDDYLVRLRAADEAYTTGRQRQIADLAAQEKFELDGVYQTDRTNLENRARDAEAAAQRDIAAWRAEAQARKDAIDTAHTVWENDLIDRERRAALEHTANLAAIEAEQQASQAYWADRRRDVDDSLNQERANIDSTKSAQLAALAAEEAQARSRWQGERDEETAFHAKFESDLATREREFNANVEAQRQTIETEYQRIRNENEATYGDNDTGLLGKLRLAKQAVDDQLSAAAEFIKRIQNDSTMTASALRDIIIAQDQAANNAIANMRRIASAQAEVQNAPPANYVPEDDPNAPGFQSQRYMSEEQINRETGMGWGGGGTGRVIPFGRTGIQGGEPGYPHGGPPQTNPLTARGAQQAIVDTGGAARVFVVNWPAGGFGGGYGAAGGAGAAYGGQLPGSLANLPGVRGLLGSGAAGEYGTFTGQPGQHLRGGTVEGLGEPLPVPFEARGNPPYQAFREQRAAEQPTKVVDFLGGFVDRFDTYLKQQEQQSSVAGYPHRAYAEYGGTQYAQGNPAFKAAVDAYNLAVDQLIKLDQDRSHLTQEAYTREREKIEGVIQSNDAYARSLVMAKDSIGDFVLSVNNGSGALAAVVGALKGFDPKTFNPLEVGKEAAKAGGLGTIDYRTYSALLGAGRGVIPAWDSPFDSDAALFTKLGLDPKNIVQPLGGTVPNIQTYGQQYGGGVLDTGLAGYYGGVQTAPGGSNAPAPGQPGSGMNPPVGPSPANPAGNQQIVMNVTVNSALDAAQASGLLMGALGRAVDEANRQGGFTGGSLGL